MSEAVRDKKQRPEFRNIHVLDLMKYRMPASGFVSILHRISGVLLFLGLPALLFLLQQSLTSEISYEYFKGIVSMTHAKLIILGLSWGYLHHFCAGIRHLLLDLHIAIEKEQEINSARMVLIVSLLLTAGVAYKLFGA